MGFMWNADAEAELLLAIIDDLDPKVSRKQWQDISKIMGRGLTSEAVRCHVQELKKKHRGTTRRKATNTSESPIKNENGTVEVTPEAEDTPVRRASSRKRAAKRYAEPGSTEEEDDNFETPESPTKKVKKEGDVCFESLHATGGLRWSE